MKYTFFFRMKEIAVLVLLLFTFACISANEDTDQYTVLARIGDRIITVNDYIQRSEYSIRPPYCRDNSYIHKKIILNSLIAEKILALEVGEDNELVLNHDFAAYVEGRKEQAMRKIHYFEEAYKKIEIGADEIRGELSLSGRRYQISYFSIRNRIAAADIGKRINSKQDTFEELYRQLSGDTLIPTREVEWGVPERKEIYDSLFYGLPKKGQVIGPVNIDDEQFVFIKVNGWIDRKIISDFDFNNRQKTVIEKLQEEKSWALYESIVGDLMRKKQIDFNENTFRKIYELIAPLYLKFNEDKNQFISNAFWQMNNNEENLLKLPDRLEELNQEPFFTVEGQIWNVVDFRNYMKKHPLIFRKQGVSKKQFPEQFKLAIVDMVRDYFITQDAYDKGYDNRFAAIQEASIWRDNLLSLHQKYTYLESFEMREEDQVKNVKLYMTLYIDKLIAKYEKKIEINIEVFEKIDLTTIDMMVFQPGQAFPVVVPSFPLLTIKNRLDYGSALKN